MNSPESAMTCIERFLTHCHRHRYPSKSLIIYEGDAPDVLYYIVEGSVTVFIEDEDGREIVLAYLNPGDFFGEMGLFDEELGRSAFVRARTKCEMAEISYDRFRQVVKNEPEILFSLKGLLRRVPMPRSWSRSRTSFVGSSQSLVYTTKCVTPIER